MGMVSILVNTALPFEKTQYSFKRRLHIKFSVKWPRYGNYPKPFCIPTFFEHLQLNLDGSNTDGSFTMANLNSFLSPYEILPIAQENKYLRKFSYFIVKLYVVCTH